MKEREGDKTKNQTTITSCQTYISSKKKIWIVLTIQNDNFYDLMFHWYKNVSLGV